MDDIKENHSICMVANNSRSSSSRSANDDAAPAVDKEDTYVVEEDAIVEDEAIVEDDTSSNIE